MVLASLAYSMSSSFVIEKLVQSNHIFSITQQISWPIYVHQLGGDFMKRLYVWTIQEVKKKLIIYRTKDFMGHLITPQQILYKYVYIWSYCNFLIWLYRKKQQTIGSYVEMCASQMKSV